VAILGANGAGKSSLLQLLGGLQYATQGTVLFDGRELSAKSLGRDADFQRQFRSRVGFLFQNSDAQLFCSTVLDEVAFGPLQLFEHEVAVGKARDMMRVLAIEHLAQAPPFALSGGEKRRVALAAVLVMDPEVLLLDEPTSNLDPKTCDLLFELLQTTMADPRKTVITATHDLAVTSDLASRCLVLGQDHALALDAPAEQTLANRELLTEVNLISARGIHYVSHPYNGKHQG
jgi:cobalt/nickel transport system ATP-binding protein